MDFGCVGYVKRKQLDKMKGIEMGNSNLHLVNVGLSWSCKMMKESPVGLKQPEVCRVE